MVAVGLGEIVGVAVGLAQAVGVAVGLVGAIVRSREIGVAVAPGAGDPTIDGLVGIEVVRLRCRLDACRTGVGVGIGVLKTDSDDNDVALLVPPPCLASALPANTSMRIAASARARRM
jgi:hypothetical protein